MFERLVLRALWMLIYDPARRTQRAREWRDDAIDYTIPRLSPAERGTWSPQDIRERSGNEDFPL